MSWIEKIKDDYIITTGDGEEFRPLWLNATRAKEYNTALFDYPNVAGTKIDRSTRKGTKFNFEIYFQGEDHLDVANAFWQSADDNRPWVILHPFYGSITVHPLDISQDNVQLNVSKFTGSIIETIVDDNPKTTILPADNIALEKENLDAATVELFDEEYTPADAELQLKDISKFFALCAKIADAIKDAQGYLDKFNKAKTAAARAASNVAGAAQKAMSTAQALINAPGQFAAGIKDRIGGLSGQFNTIRANVSRITGRSGKKIYEGQGVAILSAQALAAVSPNPGDYTNRNEVIEVAETLLENYNNFINDLDTLQSDNGGDVGAYIPNPTLIITLNQVISSAVSVLFTTSLNSRQERTIYLEADTDLINLTHRLYGLDPEDNNINELIKNNNWGFNEILEIRKGTKVIYYI